VNIDYNKLSVPAMRELLRFHPLRQVIRHFEARGYTPKEIDAKYRQVAHRPYLREEHALDWTPDPALTADSTDPDVPW
jgi:hypothetical protein